MPIKFRDIFNDEWFKAHTRLKPNGKTYETRCTIDKVAISGSGASPEIAAEKFIAQLASFKNKAKKKDKKAKPVTLTEFTEAYLEQVKKPTVKPITFNSLVILYRAHVKPFFKKQLISDITAMQIQPLFTKLFSQGKTRTAQNVKVLLNQVFKAAISERLITFNPMDGVKVLKHHYKNGTALTYDEEREFLKRLENSRYKLTFTLMLFCGMRRGELCTAEIDGEFITVKNGKKRLSDLESVRRIPITPMLKRYLDGATANEFKEAISFSSDTLSRAFKDLCPSHHLHELRHTFVTRCQECGVAREVVSVWAGHAADSTMTSTVYTHFSADFMLKEGAKIDYYNRVK